MQRKTVLAALALAALSPLTALAAQPGFYFGGSFGTARYDEKQSDIDESLIDELEDVGFGVDGESHFDKTDTSFSAFAGYQILPYLAVEAGYLDLGKSKYSADVDLFVPGLGGTSVSTGASVEAHGPTVSALGMLPLGEHIDLFARAGVFFSDVKVKATVDDETTSTSGKDVDGIAGLGAGWNITRNLTLRLEWQHLGRVGKKNKTGEDDIDNFALGVLVRI